MKLLAAKSHSKMNLMELVVKIVCWINAHNDLNVTFDTRTTFEMKKL